jgi:phospholipid/cholesterol/gamma-HCH transport system ATP-binding protein
MKTSKAHDTPEIEFRNVWKQFPRAPKATLAGMNLICKPQSIHVLIGYSGAGKSVTLKHVLGLMQPDDGDVVVQGVSIQKLDDVELRDFRKKFGMLFQSSALFDSLDVYENVAFPIREHRRHWSDKQLKERVHRLLRDVGLEAAIHKMPSELSGGMQKRVSLARAIALDPEILLFDEPTTGLDPVTSQVIDELIVATTRQLKATSLIISHDIVAALRMADFVSMIGDGTIVETATPHELLKSDNDMVKRFLVSSGIEGKLI